jgi:hypothetical protein
MKAKSKLRFSFWLLFALVIIGGALSLFYLRQISKGTEIILKDNYNTLQMTQAMRIILDENDLPLPSSAVNEFSQQLLKEENNITEPGEAAAVARLRQSFELVRQPALTLDQSQQATRSAREAIRQIEDLNMQAIIRKHDRAQGSIKNATLYLSLIGCLTFLLLFSLIFNLPDMIAENRKPYSA